MEAIKCSMCGANLQIEIGKDLVECLYCGCVQRLSLSNSKHEPNITNLLKRGNIALEDNMWKEAERVFNEVLVLFPECAEAYLGLAMIARRVCTIEDLIARFPQHIKTYQRAKQFASGELLQRISDIEEKVAKEREAAIKNAEDAIKDAEDAIKKKIAQRREELHFARDVLIAGGNRSIGLQTNGTLMFSGEEICGDCSLINGPKYAAISCGSDHIVALRNDGSVIAKGEVYDGLCDVQKWKHVVAISAGDSHTLGLLNDGRVIATGQNGCGQCNISDWRNIIKISAGGLISVGLTNDGRVVATRDSHDITTWENIIDICAGSGYAVGLNANGTVVTTALPHLECKTSEWNDIVCICAGSSHIVGLRSDGTVVATGRNTCGECEVSGWNNIVSVSAGTFHTLGLRSDGVVLATGNNSWGQCNVSHWRSPGGFAPEEYANRQGKNLCQHCGGSFKGLFSKSCTICGAPKDY